MIHIPRSDKACSEACAFGRNQPIYMCSVNSQIYRATYKSQFLQSCLALGTQNRIHYSPLGYACRLNKHFHLVCSAGGLTRSGDTCQPLLSIIFVFVLNLRSCFSSPPVNFLTGSESAGNEARVKEPFLSQGSQANVDFGKRLLKCRKPKISPQTEGYAAMSLSRWYAQSPSHHHESLTGAPFMKMFQVTKEVK